MTINDKVAARIKELREGNNLLQKTVADSLALSESAYSRLEAGKTHINIDTIFRLSEIFECKISDILITIEKNNETDNLDAMLLSELKNLVQKIKNNRDEGFN